MFLAWFDSRIEEPSGADTGGGGTTITLSQLEKEKDIRHLTKLTSVSYGFVLLSINDFVITLSK